MGTETALDQRNSWALITTLSGDIGQDDLTDANQLVETPAAIVAPNSYHVVVASGTDNTARLDGFAITAGQANGAVAAKQHEGGGLFAESGSPTLNNLALVGNVAVEGGAMTLAAGSNPPLANAWFGGNGATDYGGALHNESSSPTLTNVLFSGNRAVSGGGAIYNLASSPTLVNVTVASNAAGSTVSAAGTELAAFAGGIFNFTGSKPLLRNTIIWNNQDGSGIGTPSASMRNMDAGSTPSADYCDIQGLAGVVGLLYDSDQHRPEPPLPLAAEPEHRAQLRRRPAPADRVTRHRRGQQRLQQPAARPGRRPARASPTARATASPLSTWVPSKRRCCWRRTSRWRRAPVSSSASVGDAITYTYAVTNTGNTTVTLAGSDDKVGAIALAPSTLAPGAAANGSAVYTVAAGDLPLLVNTVFVTATAPNGAQAYGAASAQVPLQVSTAMAVTKTASAASAKVGDPITYTYQVQNIGAGTLTNIVGVDNKLGTVTLNSTALLPSASATGTLTYVLQESDLPIVNNLFTVTATLGASTEVETHRRHGQGVEQSGHCLGQSGEHARGQGGRDDRLRLCGEQYRHGDAARHRADRRQAGRDHPGHDHAGAGGRHDGHGRLHDAGQRSARAAQQHCHRDRHRPDRAGAHCPGQCRRGRLLPAQVRRADGGLHRLTGCPARRSPTRTRS